MPTVLDEFQRILATRKALGQKSVWLSGQNQFLLHAKIPAKVTLSVGSTVASVTPAPPTPPPSSPSPPTPLVPAVEIPGSTPQVSQAQVFTPVIATGLSWEELEYAMEKCTACPLAGTRHRVVCGSGCKNARLMFIGDSPGEEEDKQGLPFVGRSGQMLTNMIAAMGFDRNSSDPANGVFIANVVKCCPPDNQNPHDGEASTCIPFLQRQIELVQPKVIVLLGALALRFLLHKNGITKLRGNWLDYQGIPVMPTFHPAYLLRFEHQKKLFVEEKRKVWNDLQEVMKRLQG